MHPPSKGCAVEIVDTPVLVCILRRWGRRRRRRVVLSAQACGVSEIDWTVENVGVEVGAAAPKPQRVFRNEPLVNWGVVARSVEVNTRAVVLNPGVLERVCVGRANDGRAT